MDDRLLPRKVPEPTRFPSVIFEPCVPDASLVFGCGLFEAPKASTDVTEPLHKTASTEDVLNRGTREAVVPSWIKAYGVEKKTSIDTCNFKQSDRKSMSTEGRRRADFEVLETKSADNCPGRTDLELGGEESVFAGRTTGVRARGAELVGYENSAAVRETEIRGEKFRKSAVGNFPEDTGTTKLFTEKHQFCLEGSKFKSLRTRSEISDHHSTERQGGATSVPRQCTADEAGRTRHPARDLPDLTDIHRDDALPVSSPAAGGKREDVEECVSFPPCRADRPAGVTHSANLSDPTAVATVRGVVPDVSAPRPPRPVECQKEGDRFPEPHKGFISSDCSLSDYTPLDSGKRRGKWKNRAVKGSDQDSALHENAGRAVRESAPQTVGSSKMRGIPGRAKRRDAAGTSHGDFGNARTLEELGGARDSVSDPLIRALFHLQNRHTELLLKLAADVGEVALKQKRMFDVFQRLQTAFCDGGAGTAVSGRDRKRHCDKCTQTQTQTDCDVSDRVPQATADASTQSDRPGEAEDMRMPAAGTDCGAPKDFGAAVCPTSEEVARLAESGTCFDDRSESRGVGARADAGASENSAVGSVSPSAVRKLVGVARRIAARVEDSAGKMKPSSQDTSSKTRESDEERGDRSREADVAGLVAAMRSVASRYKNNDFIKAPNLAVVTEASENSSDSEDGEASEADDESLTVGDLSLVPQNVSLSPNPSLRMDLRGLEISSDVLASGSDSSETEESAHCFKEKEEHSENTDTTAINLYRNIFTKVQEILEHSKTVSESRRESSGKKPSTREAEDRRMRTRSH